MPTILDAGSVQLSNADVLHWIRTTRERQAKEDADLKAAGRARIDRPARYVNSLRKHERELTSKKMPYADNPGAYQGQNRNASLMMFVEKCDEDIAYPLEAEYKDKSFTLAQLRQALGKKYEDKAFTPTELLMLQNIAPQDATLMTNMIESCEERFSDDETQKIIQNIQDIFRCGDTLPQRHVNGDAG